MTHPLVHIHDAKTGLISTREMTVEEKAAHDISVAENREQELAKAKAAQDAAAAQASAKTKLAALGLTEAEIIALVGA